MMMARRKKEAVEMLMDEAWQRRFPGDRDRFEMTLIGAALVLAAGIAALVWLLY